MSAAANYLVDLSKLMVTVYNRAELKGLCDHLEVNFDELRDAGIVEQVRELTLLMARRERLPELLATLRADRPNTDWPPVPPDFRLPASLAAPYPGSLAAGSSRGPLDYDSRQHRLNQENVTANVRSAYIDGILREALPERVRIALALDTPAQALRRTMRLVVGPEPRSLESAADVAALFKESGRALLILGAPGAGKTITLLELCEPLLRRAADDPAEPVPVVLNLSTWAQKQAPLEAWIIEEMNRQYGLSKKVTPRWLEADHLVLLLDGLDEVAADARDACVRAINAFRETHGAGIVICSRTADYAELVERLNLSRAVEIQPLTPAQIDAYLSDERLQLAAVRQAIAADDALRELATTPLMLNVMAVAYRGRPYGELLPRLNSPDERRAHLYDAYIAAMFRRHPLERDDAAADFEADYTAAQALCWLRFIAGQLTRQNETQFFIEDLRPEWLPARREGVLARISGGILASIVFSAAYISNFGASAGVLVAALLGMIVGVMPDWARSLPIEESKRFVQPNEGTRRRLQSVLLSVLIIIFPLSLAAALSADGLVSVLSSGLYIALLVALATGLEVFKHYVLRLLLHFHHLLPLRLIPFLDAMHRRILIYRAGGHYRFIHRTFQEHIAALSDERIEELAALVDRVV